MSQLSNFLGGLWKDIEAPFIGALNSVKSAFESKDATQVVNSIAGLIKVGAVAIENAAGTAQSTGLALTGPDKKATVQTAVQSVVAPEIANLSLPGLDAAGNAQAQSFFGNLLNGLISVGIDAAVAALNKNGWKL